MRSSQWKPPEVHPVRRVRQVRLVRQAQYPCERAHRDHTGARARRAMGGHDGRPRRVAADHDHHNRARAHTALHDADFRTWVGALDEGILAAGWVAATDSGQLAIATATKPAINVYVGYRPYRLNDSNSAASPISIRVGFGTGALAAGTNPAIKMAVGNGTDGAGNLTGNKTAPTTDLFANNAWSARVIIGACTVDGFGDPGGQRLDQSVSAVPGRYPEGVTFSLRCVRP